MYSLMRRRLSMQLGTRARHTCPCLRTRACARHIGDAIDARTELTPPSSSSSSYAHAQREQVVEIDACRFDPLVVVRDEGCLSYDPMDSLSDIGFLNVSARRPLAGAMLAVLRALRV
jgi:hypothetical protein